MSDARLLADALAPTGIQALLLEHAAPQIAADANAMLADSYGERWQVRLELHRHGKDKIAEDLRIVVTDTESEQQPSDDQLRPGEQLAETLSGGEATWIRQALAGALALARARHTGQRQLTALLDEADGALSEEARAKYFDLLESQHRMLGRRHTIVVTHSQEMLDRLGPERVIELAGGMSTVQRHIANDGAKGEVVLTLTMPDGHIAAVRACTITAVADLAAKVNPETGEATGGCAVYCGMTRWNVKETTAEVLAAWCSPQEVKK